MMLNIELRHGVGFCLFFLVGKLSYPGNNNGLMWRFEVPHQNLMSMKTKQRIGSNKCSKID